MSLYEGQWDCPGNWAGTGQKYQHFNKEVINWRANASYLEVG